MEGTRWEDEPPAPAGADPELDALVARARDRGDRGRAAAVLELGRFDHPHAVETLAELLGDPQVAAQAAAALEQLGSLGPRRAYDLF